MANAGGALGVLYVIEGSTLGGQHVAKTVHARLGLTPENGIAYFSSYGANVGVRWRETKTVLNAWSQTDSDQVVTSANAAFEALTRWLADSFVGATPASPAAAR
ncbi:MAG: biliverdin-producing heme oxygenase [Tepidisphaeraceae bacterium]